ncbi:heavy-metal-associated domain-containing protein [Methyloterricola oryzae]|uniref:heavy-metal-associated domain-containing protein n=1 Tax=Methyloterricola oryzae TaxID=1495050 RepID=UPI0005EBCDA4|nr:heavy metal-associated domain-containing protein [Methyloterricola oryzae]
MKTELTVNGMKCGGCENNVQDTVKGMPGVVSVVANHKESKVEIEYEEGVADLEEIREAIAGKGFEVE